MLNNTIKHITLDAPLCTMKKNAMHQVLHGAIHNTVVKLIELQQNRIAGIDQVLK